jgi:hypothetical protein
MLRHLAGGLLHDLENRLQVKMRLLIGQHFNVGFAHKTTLQVSRLKNDDDDDDDDDDDGSR